MKRFFIVFLFVLLIPSIAYAEYDAETYKQNLDTYDFSFFEDELDKDTYSALKELGIDDFSFENITSLDFQDVLHIIFEIIDGKIKTPVQGSLIVLAFIILSAFLHSLSTNDNEGMTDIYSTASALIISIIVVVKMSSTISIANSTIAVASNFIFAFIPVFCAIVATGGGITTAFSNNTTLMLLAQGLSFLSSNIFMPMINCFFAIGICTSLSKELNLDRVVSSVKKLITTLISICSAAFVSIISIKTSVSTRSDILGIRSVRLVINSVVPVIGSTISEGFLSIQSYSSLIKSSVGIVGIIAIALVFLPSIIEVFVWRMALSFCVIVSDVFGDYTVSKVLTAFKEVMLLINVVLILSMMTTVISFGILIAARTT